MSIKRYMAAGSDVVRTDPNGPLVHFDDYAAIHYERIHDLNQIGGLQEENARLKAEVERLDTLCKQLMAQHSDISCENIMLRKAGDAMGDAIEIYRLKAEVDLWKLRSDNWQKLVQLTKAEVERLTDAITRGASTPDARPV
jgi:hypothetical protein